MRSITKAQLIEMRPCGLAERLARFGAKEEMTVAEALEAGFSVSDILWVAGALGLKAQCVEFAIRCAKRVAHLNADPRVAAAIEAAKAWLAEPSEENRAAAEAARARAAEAAWAARARAAAWTAWAAADADAADAAAARAAQDAAAAARAARARAGPAIEAEAQRADVIEIFA